jgi:hypothetical protein
VLDTSDYINMLLRLPFIPPDVERMLLHCGRVVVTEAYTHACRHRCACGVMQCCRVRSGHCVFVYKTLAVLFYFFVCKVVGALGSSTRCLPLSLVSLIYYAYINHKQLRCFPCSFFLVLNMSLVFFFPF